MHVLAQGPHRRIPTRLLGLALGALTLVGCGHSGHDTTAQRPSPHHDPVTSTVPAHHPTVATVATTATVVTMAPVTTTTGPTPPPTAAATAAGQPIMQSEAPVPAQAVAQPSGLCSVADAQAFAHHLLDPHGIAIPSFVMIANGSRPYYQMASSTIYLATCSDLDGTAHEIGHYVMDVANSFNFTLHTADAAAHFVGGTWISGTEKYPGVEYAAHCIGNQLYGSGPYTKCPDATMAAYATQVIARA